MSVAAIATTAAGCGSSHATASPEARLQRADLVAVTRALTAAEPSVRDEVVATKAAWPLVANGLPADISTISRPTIRTARERATALGVPVLFGEQEEASLTGPGSSIAGLFRTYGGLSSRGWTLIDAAIDQVEHGSPQAAAFARANVALYIESVYDGHFSLAQIGKQLAAGYAKLGGEDAFGASLTQAEVDALTSTYGETADRLHPHPGVKLGS
jgi:hypothetical protein